jgi:hypothetical protein
MPGFGIRVVGSMRSTRVVDDDFFQYSARPRAESADCIVLCNLRAARRKQGRGWHRNHVELKRTDGSLTVLRFVWRMLPRNGGRALLLVCSYCDTPRRHVYGWEWNCSSGWSNRVRSINWRCRSCARLRYSSEGGYLCPGVMFRAFGNLPRPELWFPYVFSSPRDAADAGFCDFRDVSH